MDEPQKLEWRLQVLLSRLSQGSRRRTQSRATTGVEMASEGAEEDILDQ